VNTQWAVSFAGPISKVPFVLLSLKAQLPLLMNKPKEGVQALHELLQFCQSKSSAPQNAANSSSTEGMLCGCSSCAVVTCCCLFVIAVIAIFLFEKLWKEEQLRGGRTPSFP